MGVPVTLEKASSSQENKIDDCILESIQKMLKNSLFIQQTSHELRFNVVLDFHLVPLDDYLQPQ